MQKSVEIYRETSALLYLYMHRLEWVSGAYMAFETKVRIGAAVHYKVQFTAESNTVQLVQDSSQTSYICR